MTGIISVKQWMIFKDDLTPHLQTQQTQVCDLPNSQLEPRIGLFAISLEEKECNLS